MDQSWNAGNPRNPRNHWFLQPEQKIWMTQGAEIVLAPPLLRSYVAEGGQYYFSWYFLNLYLSREVHIFRNACVFTWCNVNFPLYQWFPKLFVRFFLIAKFNWEFGNFWYYITYTKACIFKQIDTGLLNFAFKISGDKRYFISGKQKLIKNSANCKVNSVNYIDKQTCMLQFFLVSFCSWKCKLLIIGKFVKPGLLFACMLTIFPFHRRIARLNWQILFSGWNGCQSHLQGFEGQSR